MTDSCNETFTLHKYIIDINISHRNTFPRMQKRTAIPVSLQDCFKRSLEWPYDINNTIKALTCIKKFMSTYTQNMPNSQNV